MGYPLRTQHYRVNVFFARNPTAEAPNEAYSHRALVGLSSGFRFCEKTLRQTGAAYGDAECTEDVETIPRGRAAPGTSSKYILSGKVKERKKRQITLLSLFERCSVPTPESAIQDDVEHDA